MGEIYDNLKKIGFDNIAEIPTEEIIFEPTLVDFCKMNTCGNYGKCYTCPPYVGETEKLIEKAQSYENMVVFQKIYKLEDSYDVEGMYATNDDFRNLTQRVGAYCRENLDDFLILGAGGCKLCPRCGILDNIPCRFPDRAYASLESYGIFVSGLADTCNMKYINGQDTVTYFGGIFCRKGIEL